MKILQVFSWCLLSALSVVRSSVTKVMGVEGGPVYIRCSHTWAWSTIKYFCKGTCSGQDILIKTTDRERSSEKERYSIYDFRNGDLNVTIKDLKKSDSGTYWCGVERVGLDTYQEVYLTVTDAPSTTKPSTFTPKTHVITSLSNIYGTSPNVSTMFQTTGAGLMVWTSVSLVVMVTVMGLVLALFCITRRGSRRPTSPQLVYKNTNTAPSGEVDRLYENTRTPKKERYIPVVPVNSPNASTTYPADHASKSYPADHASTIYPPGHTSTTYPADHASTIYPADHTSTIYPPGHTSSKDPPGHTSTTYPAGEVTSSSHFEFYVNVTDLNVLCDSCVM